MSEGPVVAHGRYMYLLEDATGSRDAALAIVAQVVNTTYDFAHEAEVMLKARAALATAVEQALDDDDLVEKEGARGRREK